MIFFEKVFEECKTIQLPLECKPDEKSVAFTFKKKDGFMTDAKPVLGCAKLRVQGIANSTTSIPDRCQVFADIDIKGTFEVKRWSH